MKRKSGHPVAVPAVPEDVRAEADAEERRRGLAAANTQPAPDAVPEDVRGELDLEARRAELDLHTRLSEGRPPAEDDPRA